MPPPEPGQPWPDATGVAQPGHAPPASVAAGPAVPRELLALNQYDDIQFLDKGGMGAVYRATNRLMARDEVLKVVGREFLNRPDLVERFLREIRAAAKLGHPNVVAAYSAYEVDGNLVFAMEYVPGESLSEVVKSRGPVPPPVACFYAYQVAVGLQHAHEKGMVHRDIKPGNLRLLREGRKRTVKILDFGLAKATSERSDTDLTGSGIALGTPDYMPPEQANDAATADIRADIYALGGTLVYLLTGRPPFRGATVYALLLAHREQPPPPLDELVPGLPAGLSEVVYKMLAKDPADRFQTPAEAARALARFMPVGPGGRPADPAASANEMPIAPPQPGPARSPAASAVPPSSPSWGDDEEDGWLKDLPEAEGDGGAANLQRRATPGWVKELPGGNRAGAKPPVAAKPVAAQPAADTARPGATPVVAKRAEPVAPPPDPAVAGLPPRVPAGTPLPPPPRRPTRRRRWVWVAVVGGLVYILALLMFAKSL